jgi:hypothetical protein
MNIARITLSLIHMRGHDRVARTHGAKHRDYYFFKDPNSSKYRRVYQEGETDAERGTFPLERVNADIADITSGYDVKDVGLCVTFETAEEVDAERKRIEDARVAAEEARRQLAEDLAAQERALDEARTSKEQLERGVNEQPEEEPSTDTPPAKKKTTIRAGTGKPLNIGA